MKRIKAVRNSRESSLFSISCFLQPVGYGRLINKNIYIFSCLKLLILLGVLSLSTLTGWAGINEWTSNGPKGGDALVAISPNYATDATVFAVTSQTFLSHGGVYKSIDGGQHWIWLSYSPPSVGSIAISPNYANDLTIFGGTGGGLYKSTDGGQNWTQIGLVGMDVVSIAISPNYATDATVFAISRDGIYKSTDGGGSWISCMNGLNASTDIYSIAISPNYATDATVFAGTHYGLYKSTNGGGSWTRLTSTDAGSVAISPNYAADATVFAAMDGCVYKSTDGGQNWTQMDNSHARWHSFAISPNYATDATVFAGTVYDINPGNIYKSTDGGQNWTESGLMNANVGSIAVSPNYAADATVFAGTEYGGGVYKSTDGGQNWTQRGLTPMQVYSIAVSPNYVADTTVFAGTSYGGVYKSADGGQNWIQSGLVSMNVHSLAISPNYANDLTIFGGTGGGLSGGGLYKSTDGGQNWTQIYKWSVGAVAVSPNYATDATVFAAADGAYKSIDGGQHWIWLSYSPPSVHSFAISPNYAADATVFAGTGDGIYKSADGGRNRIHIGFVGVAVTSVAVSSNYAADATVFAGTRDGLYKSTDGGQNWTQIDNGLIRTDVYSVVTSPNYIADATVFAVTGDGVYKSIDGGLNWTPMNNGLTNGTVITVISPNYAADATIFAGGHGVFTYTTVPPISVTPKSYAFGNILVGSLSTAQTFKVSNTGTVDLVVGAITLTGTNVSEFRMLNDYCSGQTLAPSNSCTIEAVFSPTSTGTKSANLSIPSNSSVPIVDVSLTGASVLVISVAPEIYDFGNVLVGSPSAAQTFAVSNTGTADLVIGTITVTGTNASEFSMLSDNCSGQTLAPSGSCTFQVVFSPASTGTKDANLIIPSNDRTMNQPSLSGTGVLEVGCNLVPDATSIQRQGTLGFQATVKNNTGEVQIFKFATWITKPTGGKYPPTGYLIGPAEVKLGPHGSTSSHFSQYVPNTAPLGTYTYHGYVGVLGNIYDECQFQFTVTQ